MGLLSVVPATSVQSDPPIGELVGVSKRFGAVQALSDVSIDILPGVVHALVGENGAGKSTLTKILAGAISPDSGELRIAGQPVRFSSPAQAIRAGIGVIYQDLSLLPHLSVAANIFLGHEPRTRFRLLDDRAMRSGAAELLAMLDSDLDPRAMVGDLSLADRQQVEIAKVLGERARLLIMDEPTAALSHRESEKLFEIVRRLRDSGVAVVYISHDLDHVFNLADRITVLKDGQAMMTKDAAVTNPEEVITMMVGRHLADLFPPRPSAPPSAQEPILEVRALTRPGQFSEVTFNIGRGEVLGFAGLAGSGRTALAEALFGARGSGEGARLEGEAVLEGRPLNLASPATAIDSGVGYVPEDRKVHALVGNLPIASNITLPQLSRLARAGVVRGDREEEIAREQVAALGIRTPSVRNAVENLSGGNQQKVVVARWLAMGSRLLILDEPTAGVDIATKVEIYQLIRNLANEGAGIMLISSSLPEIIGMSDRILVMHRGRIVSEIGHASATERDLMRAALGISAVRAAEEGA